MAWGGSVIDSLAPLRGSCFHCHSLIYLPEQKLWCSGRAPGNMEEWWGEGAKNVPIKFWSGFISLWLTLHEEPYLALAEFCTLWVSLVWFGIHLLLQVPHSQGVLWYSYTLQPQSERRRPGPCAMWHDWSQVAYIVLLQRLFLHCIYTAEKWQSVSSLYRMCLMLLLKPVFFFFLLHLLA